MKTEILTLTMNAAVDRCLESDELREDGKTYCSLTGDWPGGGGVNVARAIRRLGGTSLAVVLLGGPTGRLLSELLDRERQPHYDIPIDGNVRCTYVVFTPGQRHRLQLVLPGPEVAAAEWLAALHIVEELARDASHLVVSGGLPPGVPDDFYGRVAHVANRAGCRVALEAPAAALAPALEEGVYLAKPNRHSFAALVSREVTDTTTRLEAAGRFVRDGAADVFAATFDAEGSVVASRTEAYVVPPAPVEPKSEVGAGASFLAALVLGLAQGRSLADSAAFATGAAGSALENWGPELCDGRAADRIAAVVREGMAARLEDARAR